MIAPHESLADDDPREAPLPDRELLRWACREGLPCGVVVSGRGFWGRSSFLDLRESGPKPRVVVTQPVDAEHGELRPLREGESVRIFAVHDGRPFHVGGYVDRQGVIESLRVGPAQAAVVRLPFRLLDAERRLGGLAGTAAVALRLRFPGDAGVAPSWTLHERFASVLGLPEQRGDAHVVELSRRTLTASLPLRAELLPLRGAELSLDVLLPDDSMRTRAAATVAAVLSWGPQVLIGVRLGDPEGGISIEEHREVLRRAGVLFG